jgi:HSP20 family protein
MLKMGMLTSWNPKKEFEELDKRLASWFDRKPMGLTHDKELMKAMDWAPSVDVTEDEKEYLISADAPGVKREDVKVTVQEGVLTIAGERKSEKEEKGKKFHKVERSYGSFSRSFTIPEDAEEDKLSAEFKEGVLTVHLPKTAQPKPKSKEIKVS